MALVIFEDHGCSNLLPLVYSRATFNLRCGFTNLREKIEAAFSQPAAAFFVRPLIAGVMADRWKLPVNVAPAADEQVWVNGRAMFRAAIDLPAQSAVWSGDTLVAAKMNAKTAVTLTVEVLSDAGRLKTSLRDLKHVDVPESAFTLVEYPWNLIHANAGEITRQFAHHGQGARLGKVYDGVYVLNESAVLIGRGSRIKPATVLDAEEGPIHIGENVTVNPNVTITGPCFIGDNCTIQSGANIRGGTSLGSFCKVGGEVEGTIFHGYSNKQHDGFVGHSYVGEWVNLGADTVTSDLKNTYGPVKVMVNGREVDSGEMFVGSIIGDHTKTGINTALPTGCVIGYASNVFCSAYAPKFLPSFSWLTDEGRQVNDPKRALAVALKVVARRKRVYSDAEQQLFLSIADEAKRIEGNK